MANLLSVIFPSLHNSVNLLILLFYNDIIEQCYRTIVLEIRRLLMPPKARFTKQQIAEAGLEIIRTEGMENLTARSLGKKLGSSACPIFTLFENMEEVQKEILTVARKKYNEYTLKGLAQTPAFKGTGEQYIRFAKDEPKLFQLLFISEKFDTLTLEERLAIDEHYEDIVSSIQTQYHLSKGNANRLYRHLWIYTHRIAALIATNVCVFTDEEISNMLTETFIGIFSKIKSEETGV